MKENNKSFYKSATEDTPQLKDFFSIVLTFSMIFFSWIFFRSPSLNDAFQYIEMIVFNNFYDDGIKFISMIPILLIFVAIEWIGRDKKIFLNLSNNKIINKFFLLFVFIFFVWVGNFLKPEEFIYFTF